VRPIHSAELDKQRPVLVLTRELVRPHMTRVTVAPITTTARGLFSEVPVGLSNGLDAEGVVSCDNIVTVSVGSIGRRLGFLLPAQEEELTDAIHYTFELGCL